MSLTSGAVVVAGTGELYIAASGTTAPTDATSALPVAWKGLGYTTEDGVSFSLSRETTDLNAWQGSKLRVLTTAEPITVTASFLETKTDVLLTAFGGGTVSNNGTVSKFTPAAEGTNTIRSMCVDVTDAGTGFKYRWWFSKVQIEGSVEFSLTRTDGVAYAVTFGVLADSPKWAMFSNDITNLVNGS